MKRLDTNPDLEKSLGYVFDALNLTRQRIDGRVPLIGFCGGPWTLMAYMIEGGGTRTFSKCKTWLYRYPEESKKLLHSVSILLAKFLIAQYRAGAQLLQVFESWGGELPQHVFKEFVLPELTYIVDTVKERDSSSTHDCVWSWSRTRIGVSCCHEIRCRGIGLVHRSQRCTSSCR